MKTKKINTKLLKGWSHDPELDKYAGKILFPEQVERAKQMLKEAPFPQNLIDTMNRPSKK